MLKKSVVVVICLFAITSLHSSEKISINKIQSVVENSMPASLKGVKILEKEDLNLKDYKREYKYNAEAIYKLDLKSLETNEFRTYLVCDFNNDARKDIAIACVNKEDNKSYLVIVEKMMNTYKYVQHFVFNTQRLFLFIGKVEKSPCNKRITICFQSGTDWCEQITWEKDRYILLEQDPYGP